MYNIKIGVHDPFPYERQSPFRTSQKDQDEGNRTNLIFEKIRVFEGVELDNALTRWRRANQQVAKLKDTIGLPIEGFAGVRRCPREQAEYACQHFDDMVQAMIPLAEACIAEIPHWKDLILSSFSGPCLAEVQNVLYRFNPKLEDLLPTRAVDDLTNGTGLVTGSALEQAILKTRLETELSVINSMDEAIVKVLEQLSKIKRVKGQGEDLEALFNILGPMIREFSDKPDVVERWAVAEKALKEIPRPEKGDSSLFPEIQAKASEALAIFQAKDTQPEVYDGTGGYDHTTDEPEAPLPYPEVEPDYGKPIAELMKEKFQAEVANDDFF